MKISFKLLSLFLVNSACVAQPLSLMTKSEAMEPLSGRIAFFSNRNGQNQIYQMNWDGSNIKQVSQGKGPYYNPVWSPDGQFLVFSGLNNQAYDLYLYSQEKQAITSLTNNSRQDDFASWSPDGKKLVYHSGDAASFDLFLYSLNVKSASPLLQDSLVKQYPHWAPDGKQITYSVHQGENWQIYTQRLNHGISKCLTPEYHSDYYPRWSPDGSKIAFLSKEKNNWGLFIMNPDGSQRQALVSELDIQTPAWSRDGKLLAYVSKGAFPAGAKENNALEQELVNTLYLLSLKDPEHPQKLFDMPGLTQPIWGPDNKFLVFQGYQDNFEIFKINISDLKLTNLTHHSASDSLGDVYLGENLYFSPEKH